jgi:tetratricopeptide (TPR) repeat protein
VGRKKERRAPSQRPVAHPPDRRTAGRTSAVSASTLPIVAVVLLALVAYANALGNGFALDDVTIIVENPLVRSVRAVGRIFAEDYWGGAGVLNADPALYRPLTVLSYAVDYSLWGLNAAGFHVVNVALHAVTTVVLFVVARDVLGQVSAAFVTAALFAVHPVHTEAVTGIVGRAEVLATLFFLLAFAVLRQRATPVAGAGAQAARSVGGAALFLLGLYAKESAATLPALLAVDDWLRRDTLPRGRWATTRRLLPKYGGLVVAAAIYLVSRQHAIDGASPNIWPGFLGVGALDRVLTASRVLMEYVGLLVFPRRLLVEYWTTEVPIATSLADPWVLLSLVLWIAIAWLAVRRRRDAALLLALAWFFGTIAPMSNVLFPIGVGKAERLLYLPSVGACLVAGWAWGQATGRVRGVLMPRAVVFVAVLALTVRTVVRNADWKDNLTLALATLQQAPASPLMNDIAAGEFVRRGDVAQALPLLRDAVQQAPNLPWIRGHLGAALSQLGRVEEAMAEYREVIRQSPNDVAAHNNLGAALLSLGRAVEAEAEFREAIRIQPAYADAHLNLGVVHLNAGRLDQARLEFEAALTAKPTSAEAHNALGLALERLARRDEAVQHYRVALSLKPDFERARDNLARATEGPGARK